MDTCELSKLNSQGQLNHCFMVCLRHKRQSKLPAWTKIQCGSHKANPASTVHGDEAHDRYLKAAHNKIERTSSWAVNMGRGANERSIDKYFTCFWKMEKEKEDNLGNCSRRSSGRIIYVLQETKAHNSCFPIHIVVNKDPLNRGSWAIIVTLHSQGRLLYFARENGNKLYFHRLYCWTAAPKNNSTIRILRLSTSSLAFPSVPTVTAPAWALRNFSHPVTETAKQTLCNGLSIVLWCFARLHWRYVAYADDYDMSPPPTLTLDIAFERRCLIVREITALPSSGWRFKHSNCCKFLRPHTHTVFEYFCCPTVGSAQYTHSF